MYKAWEAFSVGCVSIAAALISLRSIEVSFHFLHTPPAPSLTFDQLLIKLILHFLPWSPFSFTAAAIYRSLPQPACLPKAPTPKKSVKTIRLPAQPTKQDPRRVHYKRRNQTQTFVKWAPVSLAAIGGGVEEAQGTRRERCKWDDGKVQVCMRRVLMILDGTLVRTNV